MIHTHPTCATWATSKPATHEVTLDIIQFDIIQGTIEIVQGTFDSIQ